MTAREDIAMISCWMADALEINGLEPIHLGYACIEVMVGERVIRLEVTAPRKPWITP